MDIQHFGIVAVALLPVSGPRSVVTAAGVCSHGHFNSGLGLRLAIDGHFNSGWWPAVGGHFNGGRQLPLAKHEKYPNP